GAEITRPPHKTCPRHGCNHTFLGEEKKSESRLYTLHRGVVPVFSTSTYCRHCNTRYYHNYSVQHAGQANPKRTYYSGTIPEFIDVTEHAFVERSLCVFFETQMAVAHCSAESIAKIYNTGLARPASSVPSTSWLSRNLLDTVVLDAFYLHALLRHKQSMSECLVLPHDGSQRVRFNQALEERNYAMAGTGQEMWSHFCAACTKTWTNAEGQTYMLSAGVADGVTVGHPCCNVHDCKVRLVSTQDRFCPSHATKSLECCIVDCVATATAGHLTCELPAHRKWEEDRNIKSPGMLQLQRRLNRVGEPSTGARRTDPDAPKGRVSRRWTHNEQLFVRCCGIIVSRATFYGAEGVVAHKDFLKATFPPHYPRAMPSFIFYDNNCNLLKHLLASGDTYFDNVGLPIDVFHASNHHDDFFCTTHNSPALFPELVNTEGESVFNSSVAEQTNAWFGAYQSIVREMSALIDCRYNFYLDEMISLRNRIIVTELEKKGHTPSFHSDSFLRGY
ncbi:hypothetical protein B0H11DRAFT_1739867, partial [Mycena galericulata]